MSGCFPWWKGGGSTDKKRRGATISRDANIRVTALKMKLQQEAREHEKEIKAMRTEMDFLRAEVKELQTSLAETQSQSSTVMPLGMEAGHQPNSAGASRPSNESASARGPVGSTPDRAAVSENSAESLPRARAGPKSVLAKPEANVQVGTGQQGEFLPMRWHGDESSQTPQQDRFSASQSKHSLSSRSSRLLTDEDWDRFSSGVSSRDIVADSHRQPRSGGTPQLASEQPISGARRVLMAAPEPPKAKRSSGSRSGSRERERLATSEIQGFARRKSSKEVREDLKRRTVFTEDRETFTIADEPDPIGMESTPYVYLNAPGWKRTSAAESTVGRDEDYVSNMYTAESERLFEAGRFQQGAPSANKKAPLSQQSETRFQSNLPAPMKVGDEDAVLLAPTAHAYAVSKRASQRRESMYDGEVLEAAGTVLVPADTSAHRSKGRRQSSIKVATVADFKRASAAVDPLDHNPLLRVPPGQ